MKMLRPMRGGQFRLCNMSDVHLSVMAIHYLMSSSILDFFKGLDDV